MASPSPIIEPSKTNKPQRQIPMSRVLLSTAKHVGSACLQQLARPDTSVPLLFTCLCAVLAYRSRNMKRGAKEAAAATARPPPVLHRSVSMAALHGGQMALERILDAQVARVDQSALEKAAIDLRRLLSERRWDWSLLQSLAAKLEMTGKEVEAAKMLKDALKDERNQGNTHEAYELQMLLVELLIYKGNYDEALKCDCLKDNMISDARCPLYKAIIYLLKGERNQAIYFYKEFQDIRSRFHFQDDIAKESSIYGVVHDFEVFEKIVTGLKKEIEHANKLKQANMSHI